MSLATVVLPVPGGPQKIIERGASPSAIRRNGPLSPRRWSWPMTSASDFGRSLSASGREASSASCALSNSGAEDVVRGLAMSVR